MARRTSRRAGRCRRPRRSRPRASGAARASTATATGCSARRTCSCRRAVPERAEAERVGASGLRVLLLGRSDGAVDAVTAPGTVEPVALVILEQRVRPEAADTLAYFAAQRVEVKVISGDNAVSVGAVAASLHLPQAEAPVDARGLPEDRAELAGALEHGTVFGRVTPAAEARHGGRPPVPRAHRRDDGRRGQRRARAQGRRHRGRHGLGQSGHAGRRADRAAGQLVRDAPTRRGRGPARDRQHRTRREPVPRQDRLLGAAGDPRSGRPRSRSRSCRAT